MNLKHFVTALMLVCLCFPSTSQAYDQKEALHGLKGVKVSVEYLNPVIEKLGLPKNQIQAIVEMRFKQLGINVLSNAKPPAMSTLYVIINMMNINYKAMIIYSVNLSLYEMTYLKREIGTVGDLQETLSINLYKGNIWYTEISSIKNLKKEVQELLDKFISDYLSINQRLT